jgi:hypothetical protein
VNESILNKRMCNQQLKESAGNRPEDLRQEGFYV